MLAIEVQGLSFSYGRRQALDGIGFEVREGSIFGLLGPNGGGKTTLFKILCTLLRPAGGGVTILGKDPLRQPHEVRRKIGVVFQSSSLDVELSVKENLVHQGHLYGLRGSALRRQIDQVLSRFGLSDRARDRVKVLSGGLQRRLELAKGLIHKPSLLLLDEPTTGLDPGVRYDFWKYLQALRTREGMTIFLTTHLMDEAERCDELVILSRGRVVSSGSPTELKGRIGGDVIVVHVEDSRTFAAQVREQFGLESRVVDDRVRLVSRDGHELVSRLMGLFRDQIQSVSVGKPTLEDVFVQESGHEMSDEDVVSKGRPS